MKPESFSNFYKIKIDYVKRTIGRKDNQVVMYDLKIEKIYCVKKSIKESTFKREMAFIEKFANCGCKDNKPETKNDLVVDENLKNFNATKGFKRKNSILSQITQNSNKNTINSKRFSIFNINNQNTEEKTQVTFENHDNNKIPEKKAPQSNLPAFLRRSTLKEPKTLNNSEFKEKTMKKLSTISSSKVKPFSSKKNNNRKSILNSLIKGNSYDEYNKLSCIIENSFSESEGSESDVLFPKNNEVLDENLKDETNENPAKNPISIIKEANDLKNELSKENEDSDIQKNMKKFKKKGFGFVMQPNMTNDQTKKSVEKISEGKSIFSASKEILSAVGRLNKKSKQEIVEENNEIDNDIKQPNIDSVSKEEELVIPENTQNKKDPEVDKKSTSNFINSLSNTIANRFAVLSKQVVTPRKSIVSNSSLQTFGGMSRSNSILEKKKNSVVFTSHVRKS